MEKLINLTKEYITAFSKKDLQHIASIMDDDFILQDPVVSIVNGKHDSLLIIENIFNDHKDIQFIPKNIFITNETTLIEFILHLDNKVIEGVDIIRWNHNKMVELRAYF